MDQKNDRKPTEQSTPTESARVPSPRKRFRIEKVEERVAPKKGGGSSNSGSYYNPSLGY
jgi:hypothetical protein